MNKPSSHSLVHLPPTSSKPRGIDLELDLNTEEVEARVDFYSDRVWCQHPETDDAQGLAEALIETADEYDRGRVVLMTQTDIIEDLHQEGFEVEAVIPSFYEGEEDCAILSYAMDTERGELADPKGVALVERIVEESQPKKRAISSVETELATIEDSAAIAALIDDTFAQYPTPSGVPRYIESYIQKGNPFRIVKEGDDIVACASADLTPIAKAAELTDCATRPEHRGRGLMQAILTDLIGDLQRINYSTAFTLARASIPGVNLAFDRLGFELHGTMRSSCRIGGGLEDMNVWSRPVQLAG